MQELEKEKVLQQRCCAIKKFCIMYGVDMYVEKICKLRAELEAELDQLKRVPPGRQRREFYDRMYWHKYLKTCPAITAQIRDQCDDDFTFPKLPDSLLAAPAPTIILSDDPSDFAGLT